MTISKILSSQYFWLSLIILFGFFVRVYKIDAPIADWHSWRQADTAAVTRNFIKIGFNPFLPKYDDMSGNAENPIPNPGRFRFVEFPLYNIFVFPLYFLFGVDEQYHRLVSVIFSLGSILFIYIISKKHLNTPTAFIASFIFALMPFNVFFSRTTLPEPTLVFFALGMIYFVSNWIEKEKKRDLILAFLFTASSFLIKPWAIFFFLPLVYLIFKKERKWHFAKKFALFTILAVTPFIFWRLWILQQPQGIPATSWLLNSDGIRFRPAFFWWIISERLGREILSVSGMVLFIFGLILKPKNGNYFLHFWLVSSLLFMIVFATGNVRHDYYQILFVPIGSIFLAKGFITLVEGNSLLLPRIYLIPLALLLFLTTFYFGFKQIIELYKINNPFIVEAGKIADSILPKEAVVVAPYNGDTAFLYQTNRAGFAFIPGTVKDLISDFGVQYYISVNLDDKTNWVLRHFITIYETPQFIIADLTRLKEPFSPLDKEP